MIIYRPNSGRERYQEKKDYLEKEFFIRKCKKITNSFNKI